MTAKRAVMQVKKMIYFRDFLLSKCCKISARRFLIDRLTPLSFGPNINKNIT